jgi:hypothetical protein
VDEKVLEVETVGPLLPCTKEIAHVRCTLEDSRRVFFIDTPAFPDPILGSNRSEEKKVGKKISEWLKEA